jgi:hypothetical protein
MKTKIILFVASAAVVTLSFTFASTSHSTKKEVVAEKTADTPVGGLELRDER